MKKILSCRAGLLALLVLGLSGQLVFAVETSAVATSSRHTDPTAAAKAGTMKCMGAGFIPLVVADAQAVLDGDHSTMWWSKTGGEQAVTLALGYPVEIRSVEIEWGKNFPSDYEVQFSADGQAWKTACAVRGFQNTFKDKPKADSRVGWTKHALAAPVTAKFLRLHCLKGKGDGYQIFDVYINGCCPFSYEPVPADALYRDAKADLNARVQDLLSRMTPREKIRVSSGLNMFYIPGFERFGIQPALMCDTSAGVRLHNDAQDWEYTPLKKSTAFPVASALAATWQPELVFEMGRAVGEECRAGGMAILLGPGVNIQRTSTCGRNFEYYSEDPFLAARMGVAQVKGIQSQGVVATVKHFLANNNELLRGSCNAIMDERTLHEIYLPAFAAAIQEGQAKAIMSSYNWFNGVKCGENRTTLTDILRGEFGYQGFVMSDWGGTTLDAARILESGQNLIMPQMKNFGQYVRAELQKNPAATEKKLDAMIAPTLRVLLETGIWNRPPVPVPAVVDYAAHQKLVRQIGEAAVTLLKNDGVLPLKNGQKILVVGDHKGVKAAIGGGGSGAVEGYDSVNYFDGLKNIFGKAVTYAENPTDEQLKTADRVLCFINMSDREGSDRSFDLPDAVNRQIADIAAKNPNTIVVASTGTAFGMPWLNQVKGLVHCYYLGQEYGNALASVLAGKVTPSGKLPFSMEQTFRDSPAFGYNFVSGKPLWHMNVNSETTPVLDVNYKEGIFVGYRWYEAKKKPVNFPFGFGLSYSTFRIEGLKVSSAVISKDKPITVTATVTNTGKVPGAEVVQLYVHDNAARVERPYRELKGFQKIYLQPGETKTVSIPLNWKALAFWDVKTHAWTAEPGDFTLLLGNSSRDVQCQTQITYR